MPRKPWVGKLANQKVLADQSQWVPGSEFIVSDFERENPDSAREIYKRLPREMLVSNDLKFGLHTEAKTTGVRRRYIQINHTNVTKIMVFDVDNPISLYDWKYLEVPLPNILVINPENNHAHLVYLLSEEDFVCRTENGKLKNILMYEAIYSQMCRLLNADPRYVQKIMKNPFFNGWNTRVLHDDTYSFSDFFKYVDSKNLDKASEGQKNRTAASWIRESEGRNCTVFERTRLYAYAVLKTFNNGATSEDAMNFYNAVNQYASALNESFAEPLGEREVASTVKSIVNWTLLHFGGAAEKQEFEKKDIWGEKSRQKSLETRTALKERNIKKAVQLKLQGKSVEEICIELKRSRRMVEYYLEEFKKAAESAPETKKLVKELVQFLRQMVFMQFVISDIGSLQGSAALLKFFTALYELIEPGGG